MCCGCDWSGFLGVPNQGATWKKISVFIQLYWIYTVFRVKGGK